MSVFAVIKHPLSDPPTYDEIATLPEGVFQKWREEVCLVYPFRSFIVTNSTLFVLMGTLYNDDNSAYNVLVKSLRDLIYESDE